MEKPEKESKVQIGSDVFSDGVMSAIAELDAELIGEVPDEKLPSLKKAISKEYGLTPEEADFVISMKQKQKEDNIQNRERRGTVRVTSRADIHPVPPHLIAPPVMEPSGNASPDELKFTGAAEYDAIPNDISKEILIVANITAPTLRASERVPTSLLFIIDLFKLESAPEKLKFIKLALKFVLTQLNDNDCLGLITSSKTTPVAIELKTLDKEQREVVNAVIDLLEVTEDTAPLKELLDKATEIMKGANESHYNEIALITDGKGIIIDSPVDTTGIKTPIHVFEIGNSESKILSETATNSRGAFYWIENYNSELGQALADLTGAIISVFDEISVKVTLADHVTMKNLNNRFPFTNEGKQYNIQVGKIHLEEELNVAFGVEVESISEEKDNFPVASFELKCRHSDNVQQMSVTINRPKSVPENQKPSIVVDKQRNRLMTVDVLAEASKKENAVDLLREVQKKIQNSASSKDLYVQCLISNLIECAEGSVPAGKVTSYVLAHRYERSSQSLPLYLTSQKSKSMEIYEEFADRRDMRRKTSSTRVIKKQKSLTLKDSVQLPKGYETNDWLGEHVEIFLDQTQKVYDIVSDKCTNQSCAEMTAGPQ